MSVVSVQERMQGKGGEERDDGSRTYKRLFLVHTNSPHDGMATVLGDGRLPHLFDPYVTGTESVLNALLLLREPKQISPFWWEVECTYDTRRDVTTWPISSENGGGGGDNDPNPENWSIKMSLSFEFRQYPFTGNRFGKPPADSAGIPFDPPPLVEGCLPVVSWDEAVSVFNGAQALEYINTVNSDVFMGATPRQFRITDYSTTGVEYRTINEETIRYYPVHISMMFKPTTWDIRLLDAGPCYKKFVSPGEEIPESGPVPVQTAPRRLAFLTDDGQPRIGFLDGNGFPLPDGAAPVFLTFKHYYERPFGILGLPQTFD